MEFRRKMHTKRENLHTTTLNGGDELERDTSARMGTASCSGINNNAFSAEFELDLEGNRKMKGSESLQMENFEDSTESNLTRRQVSVTAAGDAIIVRNAHKSYKSGQPVLKGLNLTVPCGSIYGLLGSSGCGKTTVLSCLVGQRKLDKGDIWIFGQKPGTKSIGVPGRNIGYMPQEISLYVEFSVGETLNYFGTLSGMTDKAVEETKSFLIKLLDLPVESRQISTLSGGQKRRVSIAVAMLHSPACLVLDEPTVGVDSLLRLRLVPYRLHDDDYAIEKHLYMIHEIRSIWQHLQKLVYTKCTTIVITTHYIEECRQADNIGIIRNGRLLIERQPKDLFAEYGSTNLEHIVLQICRTDTRDSERPNGENSLALNRIEDGETNGNDNSPSNNNEQTNVKMASVIQEQSGRKDSFVRIWALTSKNFVILLRNPLLVRQLTQEDIVTLLFFVVLISAVMITVVCTALGDDPHYMPMGLVNHEVDYLTVCPNVTRVPGECNVENLSCSILSHLPKHSLRLKLFSTEDEAIKEVHNGNIWGYIAFPHDFSTKLYERFTLGSDVDELTFNNSQIIVRLDESSKQIAGTIKEDLYDAFEDFNKVFLSDCGFNPRQGDKPLIYGKPLFGRDDITFGEFLAGGIVPSLIFFFPIITTSIRYISEKRNGVLARSLVGGVQTWEIMVAYSISEFFVLVCQSILNYSVIRFLFQIQILGSDFQLIILFLLSGFGGVAMGFLLGAVCTQEIQAAVIAMAAFFPNFILAGIVWPVEGMSVVLQYFVRILPCMMAGEATRSIVSRGWEFAHPSVWPGFVILTVYIFGYFFLTVMYHVMIKK